MTTSTDIKNALVTKRNGKKEGRVSPRNILTFCAYVEAAQKLGFSNLIASRYHTNERGYLDSTQPWEFRMTRNGDELRIGYNPKNYESFLNITKKYNLIP